MSWKHWQLYQCTILVENKTKFPLILDFGGNDVKLAFGLDNNLASQWVQAYVSANEDQVHEWNIITAPKNVKKLHCIISPPQLWSKLFATHTVVTSMG